MKKATDVSVTSKIVPSNINAEKEKFWFDQSYNPQFTYAHDLDEGVLTRTGMVEDRYVYTAERVVADVLKKWGSESKLIEAEGKVLDKTQVTETVANYFASLPEVKKPTVHFSADFIARTSIYKETMNIRLPIEYREKSFPGVLDHEIGTHYIRRLNDTHQPWFGNKSQYVFRSHLETEEGLAILHQYLTSEHKYLWITCLHYLAAYWGSKLSFAELFKKLAKYVDSKERRWRMCLRVKRGIKDTSTEEVNTKDQIYLRGVLKMLWWLEKTDFAVERLYLGKIAVEDLAVAEAQGKTEDIILPWFLQDQEKKEWYREEIIKTKEVNRF